MIKSAWCLASVVSIASLAGCASPSEPGAPTARALACGVLPNCVSSLDRGAAPLRFEGDPAQAMARLRRTLAGFPEARILGSDAGGINAVFTTTVGFEDEVAFRIDPKQQRIDYRSRSLIGLFDFGKNRSRMRELVERFGAAGG